MTTVSETLNTAADLLQERGWVIGPNGWAWSGKAATPLCAEGAIYAALGFPRDAFKIGWTSDQINECPAGRAVRDYLVTAGRILDDDPLWRFNDRSRTAAEVIEVLRAAAVIEEARENESAAAEVTM